MYKTKSLTPSNSRPEYANTTSLVSLTQVKEELGLFDGDGMPLSDDTLDNNLTLLIGWASELVSNWEGERIVATKITDYYTRIPNGGRLKTSSKENINNSESMTLEYYLEGGSDFSTVSTGWTLDQTTRPAIVIIDDTDVELSSKNSNPVRFTYTIEPYEEVGRDLIAGTIMQLINLRYVSKGQPPTPASENTIRRILVNNLGN